MANVIDEPYDYNTEFDTMARLPRALPNAYTPVRLNIDNFIVPITAWQTQHGYNPHATWGSNEEMQIYRQFVNGDINIVEIGILCDMSIELYGHVKPAYKLVRDFCNRYHMYKSRYMDKHHWYRWSGYDRQLYYDDYSEIRMGCYVENWSLTMVLCVGPGDDFTQRSNTLTTAFTKHNTGRMRPHEIVITTTLGKEITNHIDDTQKNYSVIQYIPETNDEYHATEYDSLFQSLAAKL